MCLIKMGRIDVVMHIKYTQCSRFSLKAAILLRPRISLPGGEPLLAEGLPWPTSCLSSAAQVQPCSPWN